MFYSSVRCVFFGQILTSSRCLSLGIAQARLALLSLTRHLPSVILSQWLATASSMTSGICSKKFHNSLEV